jgi:glycine cleavage system H protein
MLELLETTVDKFIFRVAKDRLYSKDGIWVLPEDGDRVRLGLTDFIQQRNGDVAFADVKPAGTRLDAGSELGTIETIKVIVSLYSPVAGTVVDVNPALETTPEAINQDPYGEGWLAIMAAENLQATRRTLLDPQAYFTLMKSEAEEEVRKP